MVDKKELVDLFKSKIQYQYSAEQIIGNRKVIIYGAGNGYRAFKNSVLKRFDITPLCVIDNKFERNLIYEETIFCSLDNCSLTKDQKEKSLVIVTIGDLKKYKSINRELRKEGFKNILQLNNIFEFNIHHVPDKLNLDNNSFYLKRKENILSAFDLLEDDLSKEIYLSIMRIYLTHKPEEITHRPLMEQYFPTDVKLNKGYKRFINCGAYTGDTVKELVKRVGKIDSLICFEPDKDNYFVLYQYLKNKKNSIAKNIISLPLGVYNKNDILSFSSNDLMCSSIDIEGDNSISVVSLDSCLINFDPTFISMDIEGAEIEALQGAFFILKNCKPDLAISVYHYPNHLWDIALYLNSLNLGYKFYLRNYTGFTYETILYATTEE